jgi:enoyl-CoA hydratase
MAPATEEVEEVVLFAVDDDGVGTITINRPSSLNSLSVPVFERLKEIATAVRYEKEIKVLILTGAGDRAFSAGNDVKGGSFTASSAGGGASRPSRRLQVEAIEALDAVPQPLIASVNGVAYTGALELLLAADIIVAARRAVFCDTHARLGLVPTWGLSVRLPMRVGLANAKIMSFTGKQFSAEDASAIGLVDMVTADDELAPVVAELAASMAENSADSIAKQKRMMDMAAKTTAREALAWTDETYGFHPGAGKDMEERMATLFGAGKGGGSSKAQKKKQAKL